MKSNVTRRTFVKGAAAAAAIPYIWTSSYAQAEDANSRLSIVSVGQGGSRGRYNRGGTIARNARKLGQTIACCDVDQVHNEEYKADCAKQGMDINMYTDYRELFEKEKPDVCTIGTPDHWHVPIAKAALEAGIDVYCEKPLTLTIGEGKEICDIVKQTGRVFQVGTQQRCEMNRRFINAVAMIRLGYIGDNVSADVAIGGAPSGGPFAATEAPEGLDWDFWLGPCQTQDYSLERRKYFRWFLEYSGGKMTDWGAHHIDIAQWAISPEAGPTSISAVNQAEFGPDMDPSSYDVVKFLNGDAKIADSYNAPCHFDIDLKYANGSTINVNDDNIVDNTTPDNKGYNNGIMFTGDKGRFFVSRGAMKGAPVENLTADDNDQINAKVEELFGGPVTNQMQNFFDCVKDRDRLPISDIFTHCDAMDSCHLCNINTLLGRDLKWDPAKKVFLGDDQANMLLTRKQRTKYL